MDNTDPILAICILVGIGTCGLGICFYIARGVYRMERYRIIPLEPGEQYA